MRQRHADIFRQRYYLCLYSNLRGLGATSQLVNARVQLDGRAQRVRRAAHVERLVPSVLVNASASTMHTVMP